jgi:hypothetical protein
VLTVADALTSDLGDAIARDPEVRQARSIADAARTRLVACMTGSRDETDPAEAQRMLDAFRNAQAHAEDAEDRVLVHHGLLASAEAGRRAANRRPTTSRAGATGPGGGRPGAVRANAVRVSVVPGGRRMSVARVIAGGFALGVAGVVGVALARRSGVRPGSSCR